MDDPAADPVQASPASPRAEWLEVEPASSDDAVPHTVTDQLVDAAKFTVVAASRRGKSHAHAGTYREDAFAIASGGHDGSPWWCIAVADGAGSCRLSRVGSGIATRLAIEHVRALDGGVNLELAKVIADAALASRAGLVAEAALRACPVEDLSCTLLLLLWTRRPDGEWIATFQAGDGLIASLDDSAVITPLAKPDTEASAGETHFLNGKHVDSTWGQRASVQAVAPGTSGYIVATDGVSDDLIPYERNGPILAAGLRAVVTTSPPGPALLDLIGYEKRGSFDDRTLVMSWREPQP